MADKKVDTLLFHVATLLMFGSFWALIPAALTVDPDQPLF